MRNWILSAFIFRFLLKKICSENIASTENAKISLLDDSNYERFLEENEIVLIEFNTIENAKYEKLETSLKETYLKVRKKFPEFKVARVDGTKNPEAVEEFEVGNNFPSIFLVFQLVPMPFNNEEYDMGFSSKELTKFVLDKTNFQNNFIESKNEVKLLIEEKNYTKFKIVYFDKFGNFSEEKEFQAFMFAYQDSYNFYFVNSSNVEIAEFLGIQDHHVGLYYRQTIYHLPFPITFNGTELFLKKVSDDGWKFQMLTKENFDFFMDTFRYDYMTIVGVKNNDTLARYSSFFIQNFDKINYKFSFVFSRNEDLFSHAAFQLLGINLEDDPEVLLTIQLDGDKKIYKYNGKLEIVEFNQYLSNVKTGNASRYYRTSFIPEDNEEYDVQFLASHNYKKDVLDSPQNVVIFFYPTSKRCEDCDKLLEAFHNISEILRPRYPSLKFMKCDINSNEFETLDIPSVPEILLIRASDKKEIRIMNKKATPIEFAYWLNVHIEGLDIDPELLKIKEDVINVEL